MILKESEIDKDAIKAVLGKIYKEPGKWFTVSGSCYYFIKELTDLDGNEVLKWEDSKGIFQRHDDGIALYVNRSNYQRVLLMPFKTIKSLKLDLMKSELQQETVLEFSTIFYKGKFVANYSDYQSQLKYFKKMGLLADS